MTDFYALVADWAVWAQTRVATWPADPRDARADPDVVSETLRRAEAAARGTANRQQVRQWVFHEIVDRAYRSRSVDQLGHLADTTIGQADDVRPPGDRQTTTRMQAQRTRAVVVVFGSTRHKVKPRLSAGGKTAP